HDKITVEIVEFGLSRSTSYVDEMPNSQPLERLRIRQLNRVSIVEVSGGIDVAGQTVAIEDKDWGARHRPRALDVFKLRGKVQCGGQRDVRRHYAAWVRPVVKNEHGIKLLCECRPGRDRLGTGGVDDDRCIHGQTSAHEQ